MTKMQPQSKFVESPLSNLFMVPAKKDVTWGNPTDRKVYQLIKEFGPLTRGDLVERTGFPRTTLYDSLTRLTIRGVIVRFTEPRQSRGRCHVFYEATSQQFVSSNALEDSIGPDISDNSWT